MRRTALVAIGLVVLASDGARSAIAAGTGRGVVGSVVDGDTLTLATGVRVRLLQIDSPELGSGECYSRAARSALVQLAPVGARIALEADPALDRVDRYGRILRYVSRDGVHVNLELVRRGAAAPYFYRGERGTFASRLLAAAVEARAAKRGLWGARPRTRLDPTRQVATGSCGPAAGAPTTSPPAPTRCDPNYSGGCVPRYPPDVDCADLRALGIPTPVRVVGHDPHRLDADGDGLGCE